MQNCCPTEVLIVYRTNIQFIYLLKTIFERKTFLPGMKNKFPILNYVLHACINRRNYIRKKEKSIKPPRYQL